MWEPGKLFELRRPLGTVPLTYDGEKTLLKPELDYYVDLAKGLALPQSIKVDFEGDWSYKRNRNKFVPLGNRLVANDRLDPELQDMLRTHCNTISLITPKGELTYYLPKHILEAVDIDETDTLFVRGKPKRLIAVYNLVLLDSATRDVPIFRLYPPEYSARNFVNEDFVSVYNACGCRGLAFKPVDVSPWWEAYM
jgi:hypothetical protein